MQRSLPELNKLTHADELPFPFYVVHGGGEHERAQQLMDSTDINGKEWRLNFVWGSEELEKQLGGVSAYPSYYILDEKGQPQAKLIGHSDTTMKTLEWLADEIKKRG